MGDFSFQKISLLPLKFKQQIQQDPWKRGGFDQPTWLVVSEDSKHALASSFMFQDLNDRPTKPLFVDYIPETSWWDPHELISLTSWCFQKTHRSHKPCFLAVLSKKWVHISEKFLGGDQPPVVSSFLDNPKDHKGKCDPMRPPNPMVRHLPLLWFLEPARTCKVAPFGWACSPSCSLRDGDGCSHSVAAGMLSGHQIWMDNFPSKFFPFKLPLSAGISHLLVGSHVWFPNNHDLPLSPTIVGYWWLLYISITSSPFVPWKKNQFDTVEQC